MLVDKTLKNIIVVCDFAYIEGGASRVAHESAIELARRGYNVFLFSSVGPISQELQNSKVKVICLNQNDILHDKNRLKAIRQGIYNNYAEERFSELLNQYSNCETIIHIHTYTKGLSSAVFNVANEKGFKTVVTIHDYFLICPNGGLYIYPKHQICEKQPMSFSCIKCNCDSRNYGVKLFRVLRQKKQNAIVWNFKDLNFIFISHFQQKQFERRKKIEKNTYFLENPINFVNRYKVDCSKNNTYLFVARITDEKGIRVFCEGIRLAKVKGIVIGQGALLEEMKQSYPEIEFTGWVDKSDMKPYLDQTRCFVFASTYYEASPLTPLEMMACGIPCIVSDKNASQDLIEDGVNGYIYDGYSPAELAQTIRKTEDNQGIDEMSKKVYEDFDINKYSVENHTNNLTNIYKDIIDN